MNLPQLINRLRRVASGESLFDVYGDEYDPDKTRCHMVDCRAWANACFDRTPITEEVLREFGWTNGRFSPIFERDNFAFRLERGILGVGMTAIFLTAVGDMKGIPLIVNPTRGQLIQLLSALGVWDGE